MTYVYIVDDKRISPPEPIQSLWDLQCCGPTDEYWQMLRSYLWACREQDFSTQREMTKGAGIVLAYLLSDMAVIEHGTTIHCSWLTELGEECLEFLDFAKWYPVSLSESFAYGDTDDGWILEDYAILGTVSVDWKGL